MKPANADRIITLNCGLGRDSITMVLLAATGRLEVAHLDGLPGRQTLSLRDIDVVVFSDTGCEWPHTYALIPMLRQIVERGGSRFLVLSKGDGEPDKSAPTSWADIEDRAASGAYHVRLPIVDDYESRSTVVSLGKGDCTCNHKILPIRRMINDLSLLRFGRNNRSYSHRVRKGSYSYREFQPDGSSSREVRFTAEKPHVNLIGIAADELSRLENGGEGPAYLVERYPLVTMGLAKADESAILAEVGLDHIRKSGCWMCPYQPLGWWWALRETEPELWAKAVAYEISSLKRNPNMSITGRKRSKQPITIDVAVEEWRAKNPEATVEAVLNKEYRRGKGKGHLAVLD